MNTFLIALCLFLAVTSAYGATVLLEDGTVLKGEIVSESEAELQVSFGEFEDQVAGLILTEVADADTAVFYKALDMKAKGPFLARFWQARNPLMLKYYYDYHFGRRYVTVSDAYFERGDLIPKKYITRALAAFERYFQFLDPTERGYYQRFVAGGISGGAVQNSGGFRAVADTASRSFLVGAGSHADDTGERAPR